MNPNEDQMLAQLERELLSLQPLPPDPALLCRIERALHDPIMDRAPAKKKIVSFPAPVSADAKNQNQVAWKPWAAVAACAAVATTAVTWKHNQLEALEKSLALKNADSQSNFIPQGTLSQFRSVQPGNLVVDPQRGLMRTIRVEFNNQQQYVDPATNAVLRIGVPSVQEILVSEPVQ